MFSLYQSLSLIMFVSHQDCFGGTLDLIAPFTLQQPIISRTVAYVVGSRSSEHSLLDRSESKQFTIDRK